MGEARRRRLTLIKGGKAAEAKASIVAPERLTNLTIQMPSLKADIAHKIYKEMVDRATCPTPNTFWLAVFEAGMIEFEKFYAEQNAPQPPDIELPKSEL
jgi:hypothetical protein